MLRTSLLASLALSAVALTAVGGTAQAAAPDGFVTVAQCSTLTGTASYSPGLKNKAKPNHEAISGTLAGCSTEFGGAIAGTGTFTANLSSAGASRKSNNESGTFVINWPAASGLNPTVGTLSTVGPNLMAYNVGGTDSAAGAFPGALMNTSWLVASQTLGGKKNNMVVSESFVNTAPLTIRENIG